MPQTVTVSLATAQLSDKDRGTALRAWSERRIS